MEKLEHALRNSQAETEALYRFFERLRQRIAAKRGEFVESIQKVCEDEATAEETADLIIESMMKEFPDLSKKMKAKK